MKKSDAKIEKASAAKPAGRLKAKAERRDVGEVDAQADDGLGSFRAGTKIETRRIENLAPSPWQARYDDLSDHDLRSLAASIRKYGLRQPVEILPGNAAGLPPDTVMDGCQRLAALKLNGETEVRVLVRYDLAEADRDTIQLDFYGPNKDRRQLDKLGKARVALDRYELETTRRGGKLVAVNKEKALDLLGKEVDMSGKTLQRHWSVLPTPIESRGPTR